MKKHGFGGGPASHGNSKAHRTGGSTGILGLGRVG
jgi:ribosomal protein L3